jgi:hypothetical protein
MLRDGHRVYEKPRADKLGIKPGMTVALLGVDDDAFPAEVRKRGARVVAKPKPGAGLDAIFLQLTSRDDLDRIADLMPAMARDGALWTLRPRGDRELSEATVQNAGLSAGLVDVKVVRFDDTHTAVKFVFRLRDR